MKYGMSNELAAPKPVDRNTFQAQLDALRVREKAHTIEADAIAAARRRLPMVAVDGATPLIWRTWGGNAPMDVFLTNATAAHRLLLHVAHQPPGAGTVRGVHLGYIAGSGAVLSSFSRCHLRRVLPGSIPGERPLPRLHGLGDALVFGSPGLARHALSWTPGGDDAHRLLPATGIQCLRDLLDHRARRRGDG